MGHAYYAPAPNAPLNGEEETEMRYLEGLAAAHRADLRRAQERATAENEGDGRCSCGAPGEIKVSRGWHARAGLPAWEWACTEHARDGGD